jgi:Uma2 family endonuclease
VSFHRVLRDHALQPFGAERIVARMAGDDLPRTSTPQGYTQQQYFALLEVGLLNDEDRVELLDGVIVAKSPSNPRHAAAVWLAQTALLHAVGDRAMVRVQSCLIASPHSVPEPDVAIVPWTPRRYADAHPTTALLLLEVADSSLPQDRLSKSRIYAGDAIPQYVIVNLRADRVEVFTDPDPAARVYRAQVVVGRGERIELQAFPGTFVCADDLLPDPI